MASANILSGILGVQYITKGTSLWDGGGGGGGGGGEWRIKAEPSIIWQIQHTTN